MTDITAAVIYDDIVARHEEIYDRLAPEYDARVSRLAEVTHNSVADLAEYLPYGASVLDVGCGAGGVMEALSSFGFLPSGIDISSKMVEVARRRNADAPVFIGDFLTTELGRYDGLVAFAFIHLFPKDVAATVLDRMHDVLFPGGVMLIGSTLESESAEGFLAKRDYEGAPERFRKRWTKPEIEDAFASSGFEVLNVAEHHDAVGKIWLDYVVRRTD
jgi:SAM-dependent methyltransferase